MLRRGWAGFGLACVVLVWGDGVTAAIVQPKPPTVEPPRVDRIRTTESDPLEQGRLAAAERLSVAPVQVTGELTTDSEKLGDGTYFVNHRFEGRAGEVVSIQLTSNDFDSYLTLLDLGGIIFLDFDDDSLGGTNAWIVVELPEDGTYEVQVNTAKTGEVGQYALRWQTVDAAMVEINRLHRAGLVSINRGSAPELRDGIEKFEAALAIAQELQDDYVIGRTTFFLGYSHDDLSEYVVALDYYQTALERFQRAGEGEWSAMTLNGIGNAYAARGEIRDALAAYQQALPLYRQSGDHHGEAAVLANLGQAYSVLGQTNDALKHYQQARHILEELGASGSGATILNNLGGLYVDLGQLKDAQDYYQRALAGHRQSGDRNGEGTTLANLGHLYTNLEELDNALHHYRQALAIFQETGDLNRQGTVMNNIGGIYEDQGEQFRALEFYRRALTLHRQVGNRDGEGTVLVNIAALYIYTDDLDGGIERFRDALALFRQIGNRREEGVVLGNIARMYYRKGDLSQALSHVEQAIAIVEQLRNNIASTDLRTSYFATVQDYYQFQIDLLMELHQKDPDAGHDHRAFNVSERTRARTLLELLTEANLDVADTLDPALQRREQTLRQQLQTIDAQRVSRLQAVTDRTEIATIITDADRQSTQALRELDDLASELRQTNPAYAALQYPQPLTVEAVQTQVLDDNTTLLQYSLGHNHSYLWVVNRDGITSYTLPPQDEIAAVARQFYASVNRAGHPLHVARKAQDLSQLILAPAADVLAESDRLLIVPDGILHQVPFSALNVPNAETYTPLLTQHEIVHAPSSTIIATNRTVMGDRPPAPKRLAVIADPIFTANDSRVTGDRPAGSSTNVDPNNRDVDRALRDFDLRNIARLPNTQTEAQELLVLADGDATVIRAFDATYDWVMANNASRYQYVHFATHGFANTINPELSGLILSLVDENGNPQNGFLRLTDIFNLDLPAELVVLSACQTALGETVGGEGMVGLTRGLMYAGAERTVLSLWSVSDEKTADLMVRFYRNMWDGNSPPAAALRQAQLAMWEEGLHPYYWAAFGLQGEWRD